jgi:hypothetical protein
MDEKLIKISKVKVSFLKVKLPFKRGLSEIFKY